MLFRPVRFLSGAKEDISAAVRHAYGCSNWLDGYKELGPAGR